MTQLAATALKAIVDQLDAMDKASNEASPITPEAEEIAKFVRFNCIAERLYTLMFILEMHKDPTATLEAITQFSEECANRLFLMQCTGILKCGDLIRYLRKFADGHLPLLEPQATH